MKNDAFHVLWYVNLYLYMDLMEFEINTQIQIQWMETLFDKFQDEILLWVFPEKSDFAERINICHHT
jgi:hypothetical protein